jgi:hypothetical protein
MKRNTFGDISEGVLSTTVHGSVTCVVQVPANFAAPCCKDLAEIIARELGQLDITINPNGNLCFFSSCFSLP